MKRKVFSVISWVGVMSALGATILTFLILIGQFSGIDNVFVPFPLVALGAIMAMVGGLIARPPKFWGSVISIGLLWITLPSFGLVIAASYGVLDWAIMGLWLVLSLPGILCIINGLLVKKLRKKEHSPANP